MVVRPPPPPHPHPTPSGAEVRTGPRSSTPSAAWCPYSSGSPSPALSRWTWMQGGLGPWILGSLQAFLDPWILGSSCGAWISISWRRPGPGGLGSWGGLDPRTPGGLHPWIQGLGSWGSDPGACIPWTLGLPITCTLHSPLAPLWPHRASCRSTHAPGAPRLPCPPSGAHHLHPPP